MLSPTKKASVLELLERDPATSVRQLAAELEIAKTTAWVAMRGCCKPYAPRAAPQLTKRVQNLRLEFAESVLAMLAAGEADLSQILFSDENMFRALEQKQSAMSRNHKVCGRMCSSRPRKGPHPSEAEKGNFVLFVSV